MFRNRHIVQGTDLETEHVEDPDIGDVGFGVKVFFEQERLVVNVIRQEREGDKIDIALDGAGDHDQERIDHGGGAKQKDDMDRDVQDPDLPAFPFDFTDDGHIGSLPRCFEFHFGKTFDIVNGEEQGHDAEHPGHGDGTAETQVGICLLEDMQFGDFGFGGAESHYQDHAAGL